MTSSFESGLIVSYPYPYPYLWRWQAEQGRDTGEKDRPVCLALTIFDKGQDITHLVLLAITGTPPMPGQEAIEIPTLEIRRAGLDIMKRAWVMVGEYNYDIAERSYYFEPAQKPRGRFGPRFLEEVRQALRPVLAQQQGRVDRTS